MKESAILATHTAPAFDLAVSRIQARDRTLPKQLGLVNLVFAQILVVVVPEFFGAAVKAGSAHLTLWLLGISSFFVPLALVVAYLNRIMPVEGGLYEWARLAFGNQIGFMVAWNLWLYMVLIVANIGFVFVSYTVYALAGELDWINSSRWILFAAAVGLLALLVLVARLGLRVGKWASDAGSVVILIALALLIGIAAIHWKQGNVLYHDSLRIVSPPLSFLTLSVFTKMMFGALCGFEYVAIFAGESHSPARNVARSILLTAPLIAALYILGTSSILAFISPQAVDFISPIPQALSAGFKPYGLARSVVPIAVVLLLGNYLGTYTLIFSGSARLPMVAGWDHLLPSWFTRLHPRYKTPVNSILFVGGIAATASTAAAIGVERQEAFEILQICTFTFYALAYVALFAIPLLMRSNDRGISSGLGLRIAAASGLLMTLLFILCSVVPIVPVASKAEYSLKIILVVLGANLIGVTVYRAGQQRRTLGVERLYSNTPSSSDLQIKL